MTETYPCPYLAQVHRNLPRLLALFDRDPLGPTYGLGDRTYWAWKLIDFPNATQQGAASGLARLVASNLLPEGMNERSIIARIHAIILGSKQATARNGSLAEALPNEGSFCVTALVAADILTALEVLGDRLTTDERQDALDVVAPWIAFLHRQDEGHGIISNHLAVGVLALVLWKAQTGVDCDPRARFFLDRILEHQSSEGWFREYDGADPGYQSWLTSSLVAVHRLRPDWELGAVLNKGTKFLTHFVHPDGSYGGIYGSRMTRFCFPAGFEALASEDSSARAIALALRKGIEANRLVTLDAIDSHNLVPLFNDYVWAAVENATSRHSQSDPAQLPSAAKQVRVYFEQAGILIDGGPRHYTVLALLKGGAGLHFKNDILARENSGTACCNDDMKVLTSQFLDTDVTVRIEGNSVQINANLRAVDRQLPNAFRFIVLRFLSLTVFHSVVLGNWVKRLLAALLVTGLPKAHGKVERHLTLGFNFEIIDEISAPVGYKAVDVPTFRAIHMASQGYWQASDDMT